MDRNRIRPDCTFSLLLLDESRGRPAGDGGPEHPSRSDGGIICSVAEIDNLIYHRDSRRDRSDADAGWLFRGRSEFAGPNLFDDGADLAADWIGWGDPRRTGGGFDEFGRFEYMFGLKFDYHGLVRENEA